MGPCPPPDLKHWKGCWSHCYALCSWLLPEAKGSVPKGTLDAQCWPQAQSTEHGRVYPKAVTTAVILSAGRNISTACGQTLNRPYKPQSSKAETARNLLFSFRQQSLPASQRFSLHCPFSPYTDFLGSRRRVNHCTRGRSNGQWGPFEPWRSCSSVIISFCTL
jgi:hypothetical protein